MKFQHSTTALGVAALFASGLVVGMPTASHALVPTTVINTNDSGVGSFRQAILDANNPALAFDEIFFDIPGGGRQVIAPLTDLPDITAPVTIDGYTQPDASPATNQNDAAIMLVLDAALMSEGLQITTDDTTVRGLAIRDAVNGLSGAGDGIKIDGDNNTIVGNYLGIQAVGVNPAGNEGRGVFVEGDGNAIGGTTPADRNVISANGEEGVTLLGDANTVSGNYIGTDDLGALDVGNDGDGVDVVGLDNVVGGPTAGAGNVISGNAQNGVRVDSDSTGTAVRRNSIGVDASGTFAVGNTLDGVEADGADTVVVHNVISANRIGVVGNANDVRVLENQIGTDAAGVVALGNTAGGVDLGGEDVVVGSPGQGNLVSGNLGAGIELGGADRAVVQGNLVGTDISGLLPLGNGAEGIDLSGADALVGGSAAGAGNVVGGNGGPGIASGSPNAVIRKNVVGGVGIGNAGTGIIVTDGPSLTVNNTVTRNGQGGIHVLGQDEQTLSRNQVFLNAGLGIDLEGDGLVEVNDAGDVDNGANDLMNFPIVNTATVVAGGTSVTWQMVAGLPNTAFTVEFFASTACNPGAPNGEGQRFLGSLVANTNGAGNGSGAGVVGAAAVGEVVTATATDVVDGSTSEFSVCTPVV